MGTFTIGFLSDRMQGARSTIILISMIIAAAIFYGLAKNYDTMHLSSFQAYSFFFGLFLHGVNNIIHMVCSSDVGKSNALSSNKKAMSTVIGIIDGCGTLGSAVGQVSIIATASAYGWASGYWLFLAVELTIGLIPCAILSYMELKALWLLRSHSKEAATDAY